MKNLIISITMCLWVGVCLNIPATHLYAQNINIEEERARINKEAEAKREARRLEEQRIQDEQNKPIIYTNPADIAFKKSMDKDLSYGVGDNRTQMGAVRAWEEVLKRDDISDQQRLFATWRIGCLLSGNYDPERGEKPDFKRSEKLLKEAMTMVPGLLCDETINSATLYATHPGTKMERAERLAESYRFLKTATKEMYSQSVPHLNKNGYALDRKFFPSIARLDPVSAEQAVKWLDKRMVCGQEGLEECISSFFEYCSDEAASLRLLYLLEDFADPEDLEKWRKIKSKFESMWTTNIAALDTLENLKDRDIREPNLTVAPTQPAPKPILDISQSAEQSSIGSHPVVWLLGTSAIIVVILIATKRWWHLLGSKTR